MKKNIMLMVVALVVIAIMAAAYKYIGNDRDGLACIIYFAGGIYLAIFCQVNVDVFVKLITKGVKKEMRKHSRRDRIPSNRVPDFDIKAYYR